MKRLLFFLLIFCATRAFAQTGDTAAVRLPNVWSVNAEGPDGWSPVLQRAADSCRLEIYNRWGQELANISKCNTVWKPKDKDSKSLSNETYYYVFKVKLTGEATARSYKGYFTIIQ